MYILGIIYMIVIFLMTTIVIRSRHKMIFLHMITLSLFSYKLIEYTIYGLNLELVKIPIEYSTIAYFTFSLTVLFKFKKMYGIAAFIAFISGIGYLLAFSVVGHIFILEQGLLITMIALTNHTILFLGSMIVISQHKFNKTESKHILVFTTFYLLYVVTLNLFFDFSSEHIFIQKLLGIDLSPIAESSISFLYLLYFLTLVIMYQFIMKVFFYINQFLVKRGDRQYEHSI